MKKIFKLLFVTILSMLLLNVVNASTKTMERNSSNNYGVKKDIIITESNMNNILNTKYVNASEKIYDFSNILTDSEERELKNKIDNFIEKTGMDFVILTDSVPYYDDHDNAIYATDFYDYNDFAIDYKNYSGVILFRNTYESNPYYGLYTTGDAQLYISYERSESILDDIYDSFVSKRYLAGMSKAIDEVAYYYNAGIPSEYEEAYIDENGNIVVPEHYEPPLLVAILTGLFATGISTKVMVSKNKMVYKAKEANEYLKVDTVKYNRQDTRLVSTNTVSRYDPPSSSSSGGGGHSFGGSSGIGHSGGGRHG